MLKRLVWGRRGAAIVFVSTVTLLATGISAGAATSSPTLSYLSQLGQGQVLNLKLQLPSAVTGALNQVLAAVPLSGGTASLPAVIDEAISFSQANGGLSHGKVTGNTMSKMFSGLPVGASFDDTFLTPVVKTLFNRGLPFASAILGGVESATDSLLAVQVPQAPATPIVDLGVMNVAAKSNKILQVLAAKSVGSTQLLGLRIDLTADAKNALKGLAKPLLDLTDAPGSGLIPTLNGLLGQVSQQLKNSPLNLDVNLQLPTLADLIDRPLLSIGKIETSSGTGALGKDRTAAGFSRIVDLNIFGTNASNALVHADSVLATADVSIDGTVGGATAKAVQTILGLTVLNNQLAVFNDHVQVLNKQIALPPVVSQELKDLVNKTLGLDIELLTRSEKASAMFAEAASHTLAIHLHPALLAGQLGLDLELPSALARVAGDSVFPVLPGGPCVGAQCSPTGIPDQAYLLAGPILIGAAILVRKFALAK